MATDHTKLLFRRSVVRSVSRVPAFVLGAWLFGIPGAIFGYFVGSVLFASANVSILRTLLETDYLTIVGRLWRAIAAVTVMAIVLGLLELNAIPTDDSLANAFSIALKVSSGVFAYVLCRLAIWQFAGKPEFSEISSLKVLAAAKNALQNRLRRKAETE